MSFNDDELDIKSMGEEEDLLDDADVDVDVDDPLLEDDDFGIKEDVDEEDGMPEGFAGLDGSEY